MLMQPRDAAEVDHGEERRPEAGSAHLPFSWETAALARAVCRVVVEVRVYRA